MSDEPQEKAKFLIDGREYPFPEKFRLGDPVLVTQITGMSFKEFSAATDDEELREDPAVLLGLVAVAVSQGNPRWKRERVIEFVQQIDFDNFDTSGGDVADPPKPAETSETETDVDLTEREAQAGDSADSSIESNESQEDTSA